MSKNKDIKKVADTVNEKAIEVVISREVTGWFERLLLRMGVISDRKTFFIKPPSLRLAYKVTGLFMEVDQPENQEDLNDMVNLFILANTDKMAEIIATYLHGKPKEETPYELVDYILENMTYEEMEYITSIIKDQIDIRPFMNSIAMIRSLDLISPGTQDQEASLQNTGGIIAPGESSEPQPNTFDSVGMK
ncbi:hypothetical protein [Pleomorphovibrio marinus]|uniref:hypothetical protein n=1 Tax=Pleomorphovibrio marinus TaxID=2164132 RepID=UPI000E09F95A|nr:hypothetical protein [Pleomorphovibrio marinus]